MGSIQTKQSIPNKQNFDLLDYGYCIVWRRKSDQLQIMQQYPIQIQTAQRLQSYQNMWPLRTKHQFLVNVHYFSHQKSSNLCGQLAQGYIFTQRIPYRLSQFSNIPLKQTISILKKSLQIYEILYENMGLFLIRSTMIGFTQNFNIKIWYHTDYSQPQPQNQNCQSISQMIISIIQSIQSTGQFCYYSYKFSDYLDSIKDKSVINSFKSINKILNEFIVKMNLKVNENFQTIRFYKKQPQGWEKLKINNNHYTKFVSQKKFEQQQIKSNCQKQNYHKINDTSNITNIETYKRINQEKSFYQYLGQYTPNSSRAVVNVKNQTNQRGFNKNINSNNWDKQTQKKQPKPIYQRQALLTNRYMSPTFKKLQSPRVQTQHQQPQTIRFWKSTQKVLTNLSLKPKPNNNMNIINIQSPSHQSYQNISSVNSPRFKNKNSAAYQSSHQNNSVKIQNQYYETISYEPISNFPSLKSTQPSQKYLNRKNTMFNQIQKSAQISTTTQNYDKSSRSSISLIEDLQFKQKQIKKSLNLKKYDYFCYMIFFFRLFIHLYLMFQTKVRNNSYNIDINIYLLYF